MVKTNPDRLTTGLVILDDLRSTVQKGLGNIRYELPLFCEYCGGADDPLLDVEFALGLARINPLRMRKQVKK